MSYLDACQAPAATDAQIEAVHDPAYLRELQAKVPAAGHARLDQDTLINPFTLDAARHAAGAGIMAVDEVLRENARNRTAFCAVRPPGHHAMPDQAMGFCFFNNIAIAARYALDTYGLARVAVVDFDVHHGNGTEAMLSGDDRVLMCSFFQHPLYPFNGTENPAANMCNIPLAACSGGEQVRELVQQHWLPRLEAHRPELVLVSAGFDAHREDDMGGMNLVEADFAWITRVLVDVADRHAQGRIVSMLEGGYDLSSLGRSVVAHIRALSKL